MTSVLGLLDEPWFLTLMLTYLRVQGFLIALPAFSERLLPARLRIGLAMVLTPLFIDQFTVAFDDGSPAALAFVAAGEVLTGVILGIFVRIMSLALDVAASAIAMTASLSQIMGVANDASPHPIGNLLHLAGLALLMTLGFPIVVCQLLADSFELRGIGEWPDITRLLPALIGIVSASFELAMLLAAPFILGGLLFQTLSGVISKAMPALPIVFIGAPAAILLALVALAVLAPVILSIWADQLMMFDPMRAR